MATIKRKKKMSDFKKPELKMPGFGAILFTIVFIYILIMIINSINSSSPVIFTVEQSSYDTDFTATGLAIRKETEGLKELKYICDGQFRIYTGCHGDNTSKWWGCVYK